MSTQADLHPLITKIIERENATLPKGFDSWGIKSVRSDLRTTHDYTWPLPGSVAECDPSLIDAANSDACPAVEGDGLCVAKNWSGMASGGIPARTLLLVAYNASEVLGEVGSKLRASRVAVVALVDGERLIRHCGRGADLRDADLCGADLCGADLRDADLRDADLCGADLCGANLCGADLCGADLCGANLRGANLCGADLCGADLCGADLCGADLCGADLRDADLRDADLRGANLRGANLSGAIGVQP